jgi:hypothetical protein
MCLSCDKEWKNYVDVVKSTNVRCFEVVVDRVCTPNLVLVDDTVDVEAVENLTQDEELHVLLGGQVDRSCELGAFNDDFDEETLDEDDGNGDGRNDKDDISLGSEDDKLDVALGDEDELSSGQSSGDDVLEAEYRSEPSSDGQSDCCEVGFADAIGVPVDGSLRMEYNAVELSQLKAVKWRCLWCQISWILVWLRKQYVTPVCHCWAMRYQIVRRWRSRREWYLILWSI